MESPSHGFAVPAPFRQGGRGDGGCGLPRARSALAMTWFLQGVRCKSGRADVGIGPYGGLQGVQWAGDRKGRPYGGLQVVQDAGRCGERTERCRWQKQRSERVAAVKILSVRRKAAQKFWAPQQDHRPLRRAARNVWAGYRPLRKFFDREGMVCFGFWWRRMTRAPGC